MSTKNIFKKIFILLSVISVLLSIAIFSTSCKVETTFGEVIICESLNKDTYEPINPKNEFEMSVQEINATIELTNVKGTDSYKYLWKNTKTGEVLYEATGQYEKDESRYLKGWFSSTISVKEGADFLAVPGEYVVEFYHNGELKSTANFKIKEPESKILQVVLSNKINELYEPLAPAQVFKGNEIIYACVQADYLIAGSKYTAKWYDPSGAMILETSFEPPSSFYKTSWISFSLESAEGSPLPAGSYKVEIYYNDVKFNEYIFSIEEPSETQAGETSDIFSQQNMFTEAQDEYGFVIGYPDNFNYTVSAEADNYNVTFLSKDENVAYTLLVQVVLQNNPYYPKDDVGLKSLMDELVKSIIGSESESWTISGPQVSDKRLVDGTEYKEYIYYLTEKQQGEFVFILSPVYKFDRLYIYIGFSHESYYEEFNKAYYGSLASLRFVK